MRPAIVGGFLLASFGLEPVHASDPIGWNPWPDPLCGPTSIVWTALTSELDVVPVSWSASDGTTFVRFEGGGIEVLTFFSHDDPDTTCVVYAAEVLATVGGER